eukprot:SAG31_NODE_38245_length_297_cov_3.368687_1_plen_34_part_10
MIDRRADSARNLQLELASLYNLNFLFWHNIFYEF